MSGPGSDAGWKPVSPSGSLECCPLSCGGIVPLLRYFTVVGGALLALLFVASWCFPETETIARSDVPRPVIRIASDRVTPPRVDIDTREQSVVIPASVPDIAQQTSDRVAEARPGAPLPTPEVTVKTEHKKAKVAKRPGPQRVAANPQGFQPFRSTWRPL